MVSCFHSSGKCIFKMAAASSALHAWQYEWSISICLKSGNKKPLVAKWPCCFKDIFIYIYIHIYIYIYIYIYITKPSLLQNNCLSPNHYLNQCCHVINPCEIWMKMQHVQAKKINFKISSTKWRPFCLVPNVLIYVFNIVYCTHKYSLPAGKGDAVDCARLLEEVGNYKRVSLSTVLESGRKVRIPELYLAGWKEN